MFTHTTPIHRATRLLLCAVLVSLSSALLSCKSSVPKTPNNPNAPLAVAEGLKVTMNMTLTLPDKTVVSTEGKEPVIFIQGRHDIWPSLETALTGLRAGEKKTVTLTANQAAGPYDASKRRTVKTEQLPKGTIAGAKVRSNNGDLARVVSISDDHAELDFNDPLAGKDLVVEATILNVEQP